ncbi:MAG: Tex-like N-terminal domain-containing protein [Planctomycetaceae bacterium]
MDDPSTDLARLAKELGHRLDQVRNVVELLDVGNTIPFITRYRKEKTGNLDEEQLRTIEQRVRSIRQLRERAAAILRLIEAQGKLTPQLRAEIESAETLKRLEDLYLPFKPKRQSRASAARERGLEPLAALIWAGASELTDLNVAAAPFVNPEKDLPSTVEVLQGAADILAENISETAALREICRQLAWRTGKFSGTPTKAGSESGQEYRDYFEFSESVSKIPPHRVLAINRGEKSGALRIKFEWDDAVVGQASEAYSRWDSHPQREFLKSCLADALSRLIQPSLEREIRRELSDKAESQAIDVFARNLRSLLLQPPLRDQRVLAIDPGFRTGCKVAVLDEFGSLVVSDVVYVTGNAEKRASCSARLAELMRQHNCQVVVIGNGTACRETEDLVAEMIANELPEARYVIVNEAGASIYSTSNVAREEFPSLDATGRGTISIGRRLLDPLSELVKIEPQHIGVGMYQHDVGKKELKESLDRVVESCVNFVGVDLNSASASLLRRVSGLNQLIARRVVEWREQHGRFNSRRQLLDVPGLGEATFTQAAGFLKIGGGDEPLDGTWIHPESYAAANKVLERLGFDARSLMEAEQSREELRQRLGELQPESLAEELSVGLPTLKDILDALLRPGRDPRTDLPGPVFKQGILKLDDLQEGMELTGTVCNVVDFGAFVDVGLKDSGLVHISQLSASYVPSPHSLVSVGNVVTVWVLAVDKERKRVSLTMIKPGTPRQVRGPQPPRREQPADGNAQPREARERRPFKPRPPQVAAPSPPTSDEHATKPPRDVRPENISKEPPRRKKENAPPVKLTDDMVEGKQPLLGFDQLAALWKQNHVK